MVLIPDLYNNINPNTLNQIISLARGNTHNPCIRATMVSPGETPTFCASSISPGGTPTIRASAQPHSVAARASGASQISCLDFGNPLLDVLVFPAIHVPSALRNPARTGIPLRLAGSNPTLRNLALYL